MYHLSILQVVAGSEIAIIAHIFIEGNLVSFETTMKPTLSTSFEFYILYHTKTFSIILSTNSLYNFIIWLKCTVILSLDNFLKMFGCGENIKKFLHYFREKNV